MNRLVFLGAVALASIGLTSCTRTSQCPDASAVKASSFGWNAEDATECLQKALDSGASRLVVDRQAGDWIVRPLTLKGRGDMEVVFEDGVVLRAKRGEYRGVGDVMLTVTNCTNLTLRAEGRASFVMHKADYRDGAKYKTGEWRHTLAVYGGEHVRIADLTFADSGGDGIYVHSVRDIRLDNVVSRGHYRQGLSIICVDGLLARHCLFTETRGAAPQCGIDIEPNNWYEKLSDIVFEDCAFTSNAMAGVCFFVPSRRAKSPPFGVTLRNCRAEGNVGAGYFNILNRNEPTKGTLVLENCTSAGNGGSPFGLHDACASNGIVARVSGCIFDARRRSSVRPEPVPAISLDCPTAWHDFGTIDFADCTAFVDKGPAISFLSRPGVGLTGATGRITVDQDGRKSVLDVAEFARQYPPNPELLKPFRPATLDLKKLRPVAEKTSGGANGVQFRWKCEFVQCAPKAGEYVFRFSQTRLTPGSSYSWVFTVTDDAGKTVETFDLTKQSETYVFKAPRAGIYRFVGKSGHSTLNVASESPGWGLVAVKGVGLFKGRNHRFFFRMPAGAKEIEIQLSPQEKGSAQLVSPEGKIVVDVPVQAIGSIIRHVRTDVSKAETWELRLPYLEEDYGFAIGGDAVPVASMGSPDNVLEFR